MKFINHTLPHILTWLAIGILVMAAAEFGLFLIKSDFEKPTPVTPTPVPLQMIHTPYSWPGP